MTDTQKTHRQLPRSIWALGFVSLFMDVSSEMIHALLPVFLVTVLGASTVTVGLIEGIGEATASITKLFSGWLSDRLGKRKALTVIGYGLGALSKPFFALAPSAGWVMFARFSDRVGKGVRGAPRDALVAELAPQHLRGAAFGLRQALDTVGAFAGPLLAIALMALTDDNFRFVFWLAVIPGLIAVSILIFGVREPPRPAETEKKAPSPVRLKELRRLGRPYWSIVGFVALLTLARFSEAFLILRAQNVGLALAAVPLVLVVMNIVYAVSAYPLGVLADRVSRHHLLIIGIVTLIFADLLLGLGNSLVVIMLGVAVWGLHLGMTQGLLSAMIADATSTEFRGTGFGVFHFVSGIAVLVASVIAGSLWEIFGPAATFMAGGSFALASLSFLMVIKQK